MPPSPAQRGFAQGGGRHASAAALLSLHDVWTLPVAGTASWAHRHKQLRHRSILSPLRKLVSWMWLHSQEGEAEGFVRMLLGVDGGTTGGVQ